MDGIKLEIITGINRIFKTENIMHKQHKNMKLKVEKTLKNKTVTLEMIDIRDTFYNVFCCAMYDVIDSLINNFIEYQEVIKLSELINTEFILKDVDKVVTNLPYDRYTLLETLRAYRVFYTHPNINYLESRIDKKTIFELNIDDKLLEELHFQIIKCIDELNEDNDPIKLNNVKFNQDKKFIIELIKDNKKFIAKIKKQKIKINDVKIRIKSVKKVENT